MNNCKNCSNPITGNFCSNCGRPAELRRIDKSYIFHEIGDFFGANKGFLYTIKELFASPGKSVRDFLTGDRYRFVKPITFVIITSLIYAFFVNFFQIEFKDLALQVEAPEGSTVSLIMDWMYVKYPGYSSIFTGLFMAFWIKLFFRKSGYNLFEIFILLCFISGITTLMMIVVTIFQGLTQLNLVGISGLLLTFYFAWAVGQFFGEKKIKNYVKAFFSYLLGALLLGISIGIIGTLIDAFIS